MNFLHCKYSIIIFFIITFTYSKDIHIDEVYVDAKENGILLEIKLDSSIKKDDISAWQSRSGWFYITLFNVKGDTINILKDSLPKDIIQFQAIQGDESFQIGLRVKKDIEHYDFSSVNKNLLIGSLYYSSQYLSKVESIKNINKDEISDGMPRGIKKWLLLTGSGLVLTGSIRQNQKEEIHIQSKIGLAIITSTLIIDIIWRLL